MPRIELFYDIVSPYSYLAFVALERYEPIWKSELVLRPAFLGGVMKAVGNVPPATLPQRAPYLLRDIGRHSAWFGVPLTLPDPFPANTLPTMRFLVAVEKHAPAKLRDASRALWQVHWGQGRAVDTPDVLGEVARPLGIESLVARMGDGDVKEQLKATSDEAVERGAFGFPAIFVKKDDVDEMYFGQDRLPLLAHDLDLPWRGPRP